ncbi:alpha/beta fold hydrolase [Parasphingopyxis marina]|uniref:Palmitoyl-protein thioesterase ABHD10, mitochondrial n=1 Tax=Parasphingopyxis marina TaxID=2761622 RepID=A0A842HUJ7_9SPHN|nr:alpha/beta hydrolase [Parasphingopyxis marina]MBC2776203.1 alpha/beta hydrolase [Parasphingopyxis marina]
MTETRYHERADRPRLAYRHKEGIGPTLVFLPGYMSDMTGSKASALWAYAEAEDRACLLLDYAGCGASDGNFEAQKLTDWRDDVSDLINALILGPVVLVGSSMGGWLMLLCALAQPERVQALVGIAAAPDFTDWGFTQDEKLTILRDGKLEEPSEYSDAPYVTSRAFFESGEASRLLGTEIAIDCPVRLIHGQADQDVPWEYSVRLARQLRSSDVQVMLVKDGDHRLSRIEDVARLLAQIEWLLESLKGR